MNLSRISNKVSNKARVVLVMLIIALFTAGCYWKREVQTSQVGLKLNDGVTVSEVVGAGRYSESGWYAELVIIDVSAKTTPWTDPDLVTRDKQPIGLEVTVTYQRMRDKESITAMYSNYRSEALDDVALQNQVLSRIPGVAKDITTQFTLDQMLGVSSVTNETGELDPAGRAELTSRIFEALEPELAEVYVQLLDVRITNIAPDQQYLALLSEKARVALEKDVAAERTRLLDEQLKQEQAQTNIDLEKARRENLINEQMAQAYEESDRAYELRRLELLNGLFDEGDLVVFVPEGSNISTVINGAGGQPQVIPSP